MKKTVIVENIHLTQDLMVREKTFYIHPSTFMDSESHRFNQSWVEMFRKMTILHIYDFLNVIIN
jgi:hypothetical protein